MALRTTGEIPVHVDRTTAFAFVSDPQRLARCIPGCRDLRELDPGRYEAVLATKVAFITLSFKVTIEVIRIDPPQAIDARISGDAIGLAGRVTAAAGLQLSDAGERGTAIAYAADIALTGRLGGVGESVFRAVSAQLAREFAANLKAAIERDRTEAPA
jgi:carbon monoxide dehydrogenase subunit G